MVVKTKIFEKVVIDNEANAFYITINPELSVAETLEGVKDTWIDWSKEGVIVGIEILNASENYELINNILLSDKPVEECILP